MVARFLLRHRGTQLALRRLDFLGLHLADPALLAWSRSACHCHPTPAMKGSGYPPTTPSHLRHQDHHPAAAPHRLLDPSPT
jgi:hypothetical protein